MTSIEDLARRMVDRITGAGLDVGPNMARFAVISVLVDLSEQCRSQDTDLALSDLSDLIDRVHRGVRSFES